jgi:3-methyladenine DNA glycosylase AlkD
MSHATTVNDVMQVASAIDAEMHALSARTTPHMRAMRRKYSRTLQHASADLVLRLAKTLCAIDDARWFAYELIQSHKAAFAHLDATVLEDLGHGINSWWTVDAFARILSGPAWLNGQVSDEVLLQWAHAPDRWWRRVALVSTVALNLRSHGGKGDVRRTLQVCRVLVHDHEAMVTKAMSWALRALVIHDAGAVQTFLEQYDAGLAALVKREVQNKLRTGLKNPGGKRHSS